MTQVCRASGIGLHVTHEDKNRHTRDVRVMMESTWTVVGCMGSVCSVCTSASSLHKEQQL